MKANSKVKGLGLQVQGLVLRCIILSVLTITAYAAYAQVPPKQPVYADTSANATVIKSSEAVRNQPVEMATGMRANGKIYVVVAVLTLILLGLFIYLFTLDRKISRLEKEK